MTATGFIQVNQSSFKDLHRQLKATYRMAAMRAAMHNESPTSNLLPSDPNSLEHHFSSLFKALPQGLRPMTSKFSFEGQRLFHSNATDLQSRLGTLSKVNFAGDPLAKQAVNRKLTNITAETPLAKTMRTNYNFSNLTKWMESVQLGKSTGTSQPPQPPQPPQPAHTKLRFKLASLKCEDETDWDFGDDTISMGGMAVDRYNSSSKEDPRVSDKDRFRTGFHKWPAKKMESRSDFYRVQLTNQSDMAENIYCYVHAF